MITIYLIYIFVIQVLIRDSVKCYLYDKFYFAYSKFLLWQIIYLMFLDYYWR